MSKRKPKITWELQVRGNAARSHVQLIRTEHPSGISQGVMNGFRTSDAVDEVVELMKAAGVVIKDERKV